MHKYQQVYTLVQLQQVDIGTVVNILLNTLQVISAPVGIQTFICDPSCYRFSVQYATLVKTNRRAEKCKVVHM